MKTLTDEQFYEHGKKAAQIWIDSGGDLNADGNHWNEAYDNGWSDCLFEEQKRQSKLNDLTRLNFLYSKKSISNDELRLREELTAWAVENNYIEK